MGDCACYSSELRGNENELIFAFLELTPACNNRCVGCSNVFSDHRVPAPLNAQHWIESIDKLRPHIKFLKLTGGEPTLHPEFEKIVNHLAKEGLSFRLLTNGRWPRKEQLADFLADIDVVESLLISLHGHNAESHEKFTMTPGSFEDAVETIRLAVSKGLKVATSTVITKYNWDKLDEIYRFSLELGADHVVFNRYIGPPLPEIEPEAWQAREALEKVQDWIADGLHVRFGTPIPQCFAKLPVVSCLAGKAFFTVDPWGKVRPCNHAPIVVGDILKQSVEEILSSPQMAHWNSMLPDECAGCALAAYCNGGCRAEAILRPRSTYYIERRPILFTEKTDSKQEIVPRSSALKKLRSRANLLVWVFFYRFVFLHMVMHCFVVGRVERGHRLDFDYPVYVKCPEVLSKIAIRINFPASCSEWLDDTNRPAAVR